MLRGLLGWLWGWGKGLRQGFGDVGLAGPAEDLPVVHVALVGDGLEVALCCAHKLDEVAVVVGEARVHCVSPPYLLAEGWMRAHKGGCAGV